MGLSIRNSKTVELAREVAALKGKGITETIHEALENERRLAAQPVMPSVEARRIKLRAIQDELSSGPRTGLKADKAFFDSLYDE